MTSGFELKRGRANHHIQHAAGLTRSYIDSQPYEIRREENPNTGLSFWITLTEPVPDDVALAAGDGIHNLRSTLDHIVYELSCAKAGKHVAETGFPILVDPKNWDAKDRRKRFKRNSGRHQLREVPVPARDFIESLQPYKGFDAAHWYRERLLQLRDLNNADKHRNLNLAFANVPDLGVGYGSDGPVGDVVWAHSGRLDEGTETLLLRFHPSVDLKVKVQPTTFLDVVFTDPPLEEWEVGTALGRLVICVNWVLIQLERFT